MRSRLLITFLVALAFVTACTQKPVDPLYPVTQPKPNAGSFIGTYVPDARTLQLIQDAGYKADPISIQFMDRSIFSVTNLPDCWLDVEGHSHGKSISDRGAWDIVHDDKHWLISMETTDPAGFTKNIAIVGQGPPFVVRLLVTQPDGDVGLDFVKQ